MRKKFLILPLAVFLFYSPLSYGAGKIDFQRGQGENLIKSFSVENAEIKDVALFIAKITGRGLYIHPSVRGKISLSIRKPLTGQELWDIFSQALVYYGYTVRYYKDKNLVEITPIAKAKNLSVPPAERLAGEYSVAILQLENVDVGTIERQIRNLLSSYGRVTVLPQYNILVIADFYNNIGLVKSLLRKLDKKEYSYTLEVYRPQNLSAEELKRAITPLVSLYRAQKRFNQIQITALKDINALIVVAPQSLQEKIKEVIKEIDVKREREKPRFFLIKLQFTSVEEVEKALKQLLGKLKRQDKRLVFPSGLEISFDKTNNAILVFGSKEDFETFKSLVNLIDRRKKQVLITATVVEASAKEILDQGIRWQILGSSGGVAFGATSREGLYEALSRGQFVIGTLSTAGKSITIGGSTLFFPDLLFLYSLLKQGTGFHVISNPKVLTLDNQKATIKVGQDVPFPTGIKYDVNGNPIITYDYKYVGLELDVLPRISQQNLRLIINLKLQEITGYLTNNVGGINYSVPITSTREINSDVIVQNGQTVIIGGLISNKSLLSNTKVPFFGDLPLVGGIFRSTHKENDRTNLFIFITPYVISSPAELSKIMEEHKKLAQKLLKPPKEKKKEETKIGEQGIKVEENALENLPYN